jgi:hypothetical protein
MSVCTFYKMLIVEIQLQIDVQCFYNLIDFEVNDPSKWVFWERWFGKTKNIHFKILTNFESGVNCIRFLHFRILYVYT